MVVLLTLTIALIAGIVFGIIPVLKYAGPRIAPALGGRGRASSQSRQQYRANSVLVVVQVALALVLLVGSGLLIRTFDNLRRVDPGFDPKDALTMNISIPGALVKDPEAVMRLEQGILEKISAIPGVTSAGITTSVPMDERPGSYQVYARDKKYQSVPPLRPLKLISPGLLASMRNRLIAGREFSWTEIYGRRPVAMLSENLARELWGDARLAIGKQITTNPKDAWREVVGVVNDERDNGVQEKAPQMAYYPLLVKDFEGNPIIVPRSVSYIVRSKRAGSRRFLSDVQHAVWSLNSALPLENVRTLEDIYDKSLARISFTMVLLAIASAMALLIGIVGIYGVISYSVSQRQREIGIRVALGARPRELVRLFVAHGFVLALIGVACGLAGAVGVTRVLVSLLFNLNPLDPLTYAAASLGLLVAALMASYLPTLGAMRCRPNTCSARGVKTDGLHTIKPSRRSHLRWLVGLPVAAMASPVSATDANPFVGTWSGIDEDDTGKATRLRFCHQRERRSDGLLDRRRTVRPASEKRGVQGCNNLLRTVYAGHGCAGHSGWTRPPRRDHRGRRQARNGPDG